MVWLRRSCDFVREQSYEYLFGVVYLDENNEIMTLLVGLYRWGREPSLEKFVDCRKRRKKFPDLHIYHYANYEKVAVRDFNKTI